MTTKAFFNDTIISQPGDTVSLTVANQRSHNYFKFNHYIFVEKVASSEINVTTFQGPVTSSKINVTFSRVQ